MCKFASFFHNPLNGDVVVSDLLSHGNTETKLKLNNKVWREGHYLPNGTIELRYTADDKVDKVVYEEAFKNRFPRFVDFFNWAMNQVCANGVYGDSLDLRGLTSAKGLVLPQGFNKGKICSKITI